MSDSPLSRVLEAVLLAAGRPVGIEQMRELFEEHQRPTAEEVRAALAELESIVQTMEQGNAPLESSLAAYERGTALLRYCQDALSGAEQKIRVLEGQTLRELAPAGGDGDE